MVDSAKIILWGTTIGYCHLDEPTGLVSFEYDREFLKSKIQVSPITMPLSENVYVFPELAKTSFKGVPGLISDSLPDTFGNAVIDAWLASQGRPPESFNAIERLCHTGKRGMGALEYEPDSNVSKDTNEKINISKLSDFALDILNKQKSLSISSADKTSYQQLIKLGTSAGGAGAKAVVAYNEKTGEFRSGQVNLGKDFEYWLIKFDGVKKNKDRNFGDKIERTRVEYSYYLMAKKAGIIMSECKLLPDEGYSHFMTKRFDRADGGKIHMQSLGAILHLDYNVPGLCSYERAALTAKQIGCGSDDIEQFYRRMVFNVLSLNQDDHVKNVSFLMDRGGNWSLSPDYDVTFAYDPTDKWLASHQMSINGKVSSLFLKEDLIACGKSMDIKSSKCIAIIDEVYNVVKEYDTIARNVNIKESTIKFIMTELKKCHSRFFD